MLGPYVLDFFNVIPVLSKMNKVEFGVGQWGETIYRHVV